MSDQRATFVYKTHIVGIEVRDLQHSDGSSDYAIETIRNKMRIGKDKLVYIEDSQGQVRVCSC